MNRKDLIRMVKEAHGPITAQWWDMDVASLERFAALVASTEREACAKVCEGINSIEDYYGERPELVCAEAIRAKEQV